MPVHNRSFAFTSALDLLSAIKTKAVSPVEVMQDCIQRMQALEPTLNCFVTTTPEMALRAARQAERAVMAGEALGALHGIPISVKDLIAVGGIKQTFGSRTQASHVAAADAPSVPASPSTPRSTTSPAARLVRACQQRITSAPG